MNTSSEIWVAFARTFSMLLVVLAVLVVFFYLLRKFSALKGLKGGKNHIRVVSVHHLSAKEKLVLVDVQGDVLLLGVTPSHITRLSSVDKPLDAPDNRDEKSFRFSDFLSRKLGHSDKKEQG